MYCEICCDDYATEDAIENYKSSIFSCGSSSPAQSHSSMICSSCALKIQLAKMEPLCPFCRAKIRPATELLSANIESNLKYEHYFQGLSESPLVDAILKAFIDCINPDEYGLHRLHPHAFMNLQIEDEVARENLKQLLHGRVLALRQPEQTILIILRSFASLAITPTMETQAFIIAPERHSIPLLIYSKFADKFDLNFDDLLTFTASNKVPVARERPPITVCLHEFDENERLNTAITRAIREAVLTQTNETIQLAFYPSEDYPRMTFGQRFIEKEFQLKYEVSPSDPKLIFRWVVLVKLIENSEALPTHFVLKIHEICANGQSFLVYYRKSLEVDYDLSVLSSQCHLDKRPQAQLEFSDELKALRDPLQIPFHSNKQIDLLLEKFAYSSSSRFNKTALLSLGTQNTSMELIRPLAYGTIKKYVQNNRTFIQITSRRDIQSYETLLMGLYSFTRRSVVLRLHHQASGIILPPLPFPWPFNIEGHLLGKWRGNALVFSSFLQYHVGRIPKALTPFFNNRKIVIAKVLELVNQPVYGEGIVQLSSYHFRNLCVPPVLDVSHLNSFLQSLIIAKTFVKYQIVHIAPRRKNQNHLVEHRRWLIAYKASRNGYIKLVAAIFGGDAILLSSTECETMNNNEMAITYPWPYLSNGSRNPRYSRNPLGKVFRWVYENSLLVKSIDNMLGSHFA